MDERDSDGGDDSGGIDGRTIALGALAVVGVVLVVRVLRGGGEDEEDTGFEFDDEAEDTDEEGADFEFDDEDGDEEDEGLTVDALDSGEVSNRFDRIDVVDAVYILVAGLKAAREEYRKRTDDGGA